MAFKKKETKTTTKQPKRTTTTTSIPTEDIIVLEKAISGVKADITEMINIDEMTPTIEAENENKDIEKIEELGKELDSEKETFNELIENAKSDEEMASIIQEEINKAAEIQKAAENILKRNTKMTNAEITYFWNGINYGE